MNAIKRLRKQEVNIRIAAKCAAVYLETWGLPFAYIMARGGQGESTPGSLEYALYESMSELLGEM